MASRSPAGNPPAAKMKKILLFCIPAALALSLALAVFRPMLIYQKAVSAMEQGRFEQAADLFESVIDRKNARENRAKAVAGAFEACLAENDFESAHAMYARYVAEDEWVRNALKETGEAAVTRLLSQQNAAGAVRFLLLVQPLSPEDWEHSAVSAGLALHQKGAFQPALSLLSLYPDNTRAAAAYKDCAFHAAVETKDIAALYTLACQDFPNAQAEFKKLYPNKKAFSNLSIEFVSYAERGDMSSGSLTVYYDYLVRITNNGPYPVTGAITAYVRDYNGGSHSAPLTFVSPLKPGSTVELTATYTIADTMIEMDERPTYDQGSVSVFFKQ
ncbi:MAG: hypothetical protein IJP30_04105 [Clostridia bacterium]|nr:hypothetical protein [Clostridia bacterium]